MAEGTKAEEGAGGSSKSNREGVDPATALADAFAKAQAEFPPITKNRVVDFTNEKGRRTNYGYADLNSLIRAVTPALAKHGLGVHQPVFTSGNLLTVRTQLYHRLGASNSHDFTVPVSFADIKGVGSVISYVRRYALLGMLGLSTEEDDEDSDFVADATRAKSNQASGNDQSRRVNSPDRPVTGPTPQKPPEAKQSPAKPTGQGPSASLLAKLKDLQERAGLSDKGLDNLVISVGAKSLGTTTKEQFDKIVAELKSLLPPPTDQPVFNDNTPSRIQ